VQPFFGALLAADATGSTWLKQLLAATPHASALPPGLLDDPGHIDPSSSTQRSADCRRACFEYTVPSTPAFLSWLVTNPSHLSWPREPGEGETLRRRRELMGDDPILRADAQAEALRHIGSGLTDPGRGRWWVLEGRTCVDCCLITDRLVLFVEGKRTEKASSSTAWFPQRHQVARNLEVIEQVAGSRTAAVLVAVEDPSKETTAAQIAASTPHLKDSQREDLQSRYLGQMTWTQMCEAAGLAYRLLPRERPPT
jgi:hypothetical protein